MNRSILVTLCLTVGMVVAISCGGGGGSGDGEVAVSLETVMTSMENSYLDMNGDEYTFDPVSGTGYNLGLLGFAACEPADAYTTANVSYISTPNVSLYGCTNNLTLTWDLDDPGTPTVVNVTVTFPVFYTDLEGDYTYITTTPFEGYTLTTDLVATFDIDLVDNGDGSFTLQADNTSAGATSGVTSFESDSTFVNGLSGTVITTVEQQLLDGFGQFVEIEAEGFLAGVGDVNIP